MESGQNMLKLRARKGVCTHIALRNVSEMDKKKMTTDDLQPRVKCN